MKLVLNFPEDRKIIFNLLTHLRQNNKKIVFTNGCFDLLHINHVKVLNESKKLGDILIVGLNSDESVKSLKGENRPITKEQDRADILSSFRAVDYVILFNESSVLNLVKFILPDVIAKGGDYLPEEVVGYDILQSYGKSVFIIPTEEGKSTTKIINKVISNSELSH